MLMFLFVVIGPILIFAGGFWAGHKAGKEAEQERVFGLCRGLMNEMYSPSVAKLWSHITIGDTSSDVNWNEWANTYKESKRERDQR